MRIQPSLLWTWNRTIDRAPYLITGVVLFLIKFAIDWSIATWAFGQPWSPLNYLVWPNDRVVGVLDLGEPERWFSLTMLMVSLPFIWTGVMLTLHRLRAARLPLGLILLFFVPVVNLLLFLILILAPTKEEDVPYAALADPSSSAFAAGEPKRRSRRMDPLREFHRSIVLESYWRSGLVALSIAVPLIVGGVVLGAQVFQSYGFSLFVGSPFILGMVTVLLFGFSRPKPYGACIGVAMAAAAAAGAMILVVAIEGLICIIMAAPIALVLVFLGATVGFIIQARPWINDSALSLVLAMMLVLPSLMAAESANEPEPKLRELKTEIIINASPAKVWPHVISFKPLPEPEDWFFKTGVAYPQRAVIHGTGPGAVRHCVFSTGTFVEPIDIWDEPTLLQFRVTEQPTPMHEWSPYHIHPPHLDHYLSSQKGQFLLEPLPDDRTRLIGTTWYTNRMWPAPYWHMWSDYIIHRIHGRVLTHIKTLAEAEK
jgi:uncharacterized membrane protein YhaH (DUF805 family)